MTASSSQKKKTPRDVSEFEREQLCFFLKRDDLTTTLAEINPSIAWLPWLAEMKLLQPNTQLAPWIQKNFAETDAIRDVAANIHYFGLETAELLESRLNIQTDALSPVLVKCWRLIVRHMRSAPRRVLANEWFDIAPRIRRGEQSPEVLDRLAEALKPKLKIGKRIAWGEERHDPPQAPSDLMSIDYEIEDGLSEEEVLSVWPNEASPVIEERLLRTLTSALGAALADAIDAGVESNRGYGVSDTDVPSVAAHKQNAYRTGFQTIVRVMAEIWTRLATKNLSFALPILESWRKSEFRLTRRLALFAAANPIVPPVVAGDVLMALPQGELFLTNSTVEVYRLLRQRWRDLTPEQRESIEKRIAEGPPADWLREGVETERLIDRCRFDLLGELQRAGLELTAESKAFFNEIAARWPQWQMRPAEQAGFHIWHEGVSEIVGNAEKFKDVADDELVTAAEKAAAEADFMEGDAWQALCQSDPGRALRGLEAQANKRLWPLSAWDRFLWAAQGIDDPDSVAKIARHLLQAPNDKFSEMASSASWWLNEKARSLDDALLWPLWDRIIDTVPRSMTEGNDSDLFGDSLNAPSGRLAEILLKKLTKAEGSGDMSGDMQMRFEKLIRAEGRFGQLARLRLAAEVSFLFERAPEWTAKNVVPLFDWSSPDAHAAWSSRKYSNYIGSPKLIGLMKAPFLALFGRDDVDENDLQIFAEWLAAIMLANQAGEADYPITAMEARSALRQVGPRGLSSVGHRLAIEMEKAKPEEKIAKWRNVVGPVFQNIWPLDAELQTSSSTFKLVQILRGSGEAFPEAAAVIIPFIRPEHPRHNTSVFSISEAPEILYSWSAERMLDLISAVVGDAPSPAYGLSKALDRVRAQDPKLADTKKFQKLLSIAGSSLV